DPTTVARTNPSHPCPCESNTQVSVPGLDVEGQNDSFLLRELPGTAPCSWPLENDRNANPTVEQFSVPQSPPAEGGRISHHALSAISQRSGSSLLHHPARKA